MEKYSYSSMDVDLYKNEKLFSILDKLQSIINNVDIQEHNEQFNMGVQASINIIRAEINGKINPNQESISYPE